MKKSLLTQLVLSAKAIHFKMMATFVVLLMAMSSYGQVNCNTGLACNDGLQVSLEDDCTVTITAYMMLEGPLYLESDYTVIIKDSTGAILPSSTVDGNYIGQTLWVSVALNGCGNSCWGEITIEDKLPPVVANCDDAIIQCDDSRMPGVVIPRPIFTDACGGQVTTSYIDVAVDEPCSSQFAEIITRTWSGVDASGNIATCVQTISVMKNDIMNTVFPEDYDGITNPAFECTDVFQKLDNGAPHPDVTGYPSGIQCPNIQYHFEDLVFPICGTSIKVLRRWTVIDWCTGRDTMDQQILKILDTVAPVCPDDGDIIYETTTDLGLCTGTFVVPPPNVTQECSDYTYIVGIKPFDGSNDPYSGVIYNETSIDQNGIHTISLIPLDSSYLVYTITDACGNVSQCYNILVVKDDEAPTAVCEGFTVITLDNLGHADLFAESIDDGSWDNCAIDRFEIKRENNNCNHPEDLQFGESINFCCDDTTVPYIMVTLRVYDKYDNYNDCRVQVKVQDKIPPKITCPAETTINCTDDKDDLNLTGSAYATDACVVTTNYTDNTSGLNECGVGFIIRTWVATDQQGRTAACTQRINVETEFPFNENSIQWPGKVTINGCTLIDADPSGEAGKPTLINSDECRNVAIAFEDQKFYGVDGVCLKILRTWRVTDWCTFNPQDPFYYFHVQTIILDNNQAPIFISGCEDKVAEADGCSGYIDLNAVATDDCTPDDELKYRWEIDEYNDGDINYSSNGNNASGIYKAGTHKITFYVKDICGNENSCSYFFTIRDNKAPTPICLGELVWVLDQDGRTTVWASDFDLKSTDGCSNDEDLHFAFNASGTATSLDFTCIDVPNGIAAEKHLKMYVFDESGNSDFCDVILILQDSPTNNACLNDPGANARIAGKIVNETLEGLTEVEVDLDNMTVQDHLMNKTNDEGSYAFQNIKFYDTYHINPSKNDDITNGVSTLDLVFIQQYILGKRPLDNPFKMIAADVNGNNKVTASDLIELRKIILGIYEDFPNNSSWRFIPAGHEFESADSPWDFPEAVTIKELLISDENIDFVAVKTGDINGTATANSRSINTRSQISMMVDMKPLKKNNKTVLEFSLKDIDQLLGIQFTLDFNQPVQVSEIKGASIDLNESHFNLNKTEEGYITFSWNDIVPAYITDQQVLSITLEGDVDTELIDFSSVITPSLGYDHVGQEYKLLLNKLDKESTEGDILVYQNQPNPFTDRTEINVYLPMNSRVDLTVYDIGGRQLFKQSESMQKGLNTFTLKKTDFDASGVLYYQISTDTFSETKKMIILD